MFKLLKLSAFALAAAYLAACGGSSSQTGAESTSTSPGTLSVTPPFRIASLNAAAFQDELAASPTGAQLLELTGNPVCGVDFYYIRFWTVGGAGETTESSGALMVPTGAAPACSGPRPIVEYAHGTNPNKALNIADITNTANTEGALIAAMFAAQGYIVVAPNYAGYDISTLGYHPFLNAAQQSGEMMDILAAARTALPTTLSSATSDNGQLFLTGYSEGGHVAMATLRAMQAAGKTVTAAAPMSGPLRARGLRRHDFLRRGRYRLHRVRAAPGGELSARLRQRRQHREPRVLVDLCRGRNAAAERHADRYDLRGGTAAGDRAVRQHHPRGQYCRRSYAVRRVDRTAGGAADSRPAARARRRRSSSSDSAIPTSSTTTFRVSYAVDAATNPDGAVPTAKPGVPLAAVKPTQGLRQDFYLNDMRSGWYPKVPTLLCGGDQDPTVFFSVNTETMAAYWSALPAGAVTVLDVNGTPSGPFEALQVGFQESEAAELAYLQTAAGGGLSLAAAEAQVIEGYHIGGRSFLRGGCSRVLQPVLKGSAHEKNQIRRSGRGRGIGKLVCGVRRRG